MYEGVKIPTLREIWRCDLVWPKRRVSALRYLCGRGRQGELVGSRLLVLAVLERDGVKRANRTVVTGVAVVVKT